MNGERLKMRGEGAWWKEPRKDQWFCFFAAWSGWVLDAFDFTVFLLVMPDIGREFGVSDLATSSSITLTLIARLIGGLFAGAAADRFGRKLPLMISILWLAGCDGAIAFAPSFLVIIMLRVLFGLGMGAEWTSGTTLAMENWPARSRGIASGVLQGSWAIGYLLAALVSKYVVPEWGWRGLFVLAAVPAVLVFPIRFFVPESPEWKRNTANKERTSIRELLAPGLVRRIAWGSMIMALGFGVYYSLSSLYPTLLAKDLRLGPEERGSVIALFNVGMLIGSVVCGTVAARRGVQFAVIVPALAMVPALPLYVGAVGDIRVGAFVGGLLGVAYCGVVPALLTGLFPVRVRASCVGLVYHMGALFAAAVPPFTAALSSYGGLSRGLSIALVAGTFEIVLSVCLLFSPGEKSVEEGLPIAEPHAAG